MNKTSWNKTSLNKTSWNKTSLNKTTPSVLSDLHIYEKIRKEGETDIELSNRITRIKKEGNIAIENNKPLSPKYIDLLYYEAKVKAKSNEYIKFLFTFDRKYNRMKVQDRLHPRNSSYIEGFLLVRSYIDKDVHYILRKHNISFRTYYKNLSDKICNILEIESKTCGSFRNKPVYGGDIADAELFERIKLFRNRFIEEFIELDYPADFIRGIIEARSTINKNKIIIIGRSIILETIRQYFTKKLGIHLVELQKHKKDYRIEYSGVKNLESIRRYLYKDTKEFIYNDEIINLLKG